MTIHQLIYTSRSTPAISDEVLLQILIKAQKKNYQLQLSGLLVLNKGAFMQLLEGGKKEVDELFEKIKNDPRHTDVKLVLETDSPKRCMPSWAMGISTEGHECDGISEQDYHIPIEVTRKICGLMEGEIGKKFLQFLDA